MTLEQAVAAVRPADSRAMREAQRRLDGMAKPLGSLGRLADAIVRLAGAQRTADVRIERRAVVVFCADNGVVAQGVTQTGQEVTAIVTENLSKGDTTVCHMARRAGVDVIPVDIGVARPVAGEKIMQRNVRRGTADFTLEPAMTHEECVRAIEVGIALAEDCKARGYELLATGEMGIGNTTTSAAVAAVLLEKAPEEVAGRGAGLSTKGLRNKINSIEKAIFLHHPDKNDPMDAIEKVGGLDIAGMVGLHLGGAACGLPVMLDGFISAVAALAAARLCPQVQPYLLASHVSAEPAARLVLDALGEKPLICADMRLGEGTGAVAGIALLDLALAAYREMVSFADTGIEAYTPQA